MADILVQSAIENLCGVMEESTNDFTNLILLRPLRPYYSDLTVMEAKLKEAYRVAKQNTSYFQVITDTITNTASELHRATEDFAYKYAHTGTVRRTLSHRHPLLPFMVIIDDCFRVYTITKALMRVDKLVSLLREEIIVLTAKVDSMYTPAPTDLDSLSSAYRDTNIKGEDLVGFDYILEKLRDPGVLLICGVGGLGKTTLARKVYEDSEVRSRFECFAWVDEALSLRDVWERLMVQLNLENGSRRGKVEGMRDEELAMSVLEIMNSKRCLVVLDHVWDFVPLGILAQKHDKIGSNVLITTTKINQQNDYPDASVFCLQPLNDQQSSDLFKKRIQWPDFMEDYSVEKSPFKILGYCQGSPLALEVLSGLLLSTRFSDWEQIIYNITQSKRENWDESSLSAKPKMENWAESSLSTQPKSENWDESSLSFLLSLVYEEMSVPLKQCFLHLAHFPENYKIRAKELTHIWIAEGFVKPTRSAETEAYELLKTLIMMRVVQVKKWGSSGRVKTCQVHGAIREFCARKAESEGFLHTFDFRTKGREDPQIPSSPRMSIQLQSTGFATELRPFAQNSDNSLRSFMCFNPWPNPNDSLRLFKTLFKRFYMLRVLKFDNVTQTSIERLPKEFKKLLLLKYLGLKNTHARRLSSSVGQLSSLQTLSLNTAWTTEIPISLSMLLNLRHLYLPDRCTVKGGKYLRLGNLTNLKTLVGVSTEFCNLNDLAKLKSLLKLKLQVHDVKHFKESFESTSVVEFFDQLNSLALENTTESSMELELLLRDSCARMHKLQIKGRVGNELPLFYSTLVKITLKLTRLENDPMLQLGKLENLRKLTLDRLSFIGSRMVCSPVSFPLLQSLSLIRLEQLEGWYVEEAALKNLTYLHINYCYNLKKISPSGVTNVANLKHVEIQRMPKDFEKIMFASQDSKEPYKTSPRVTIIEVLD